MANAAMSSQYQPVTGVPWVTLRTDGVLDTNTLTALGYAANYGW